MANAVAVDCGAHGLLNPATGQCDCMDDNNSLSGASASKWTGAYCQKPPFNIPCIKSSNEFRAAHEGGDEACGNYGKFGVCNEITGTCSCSTGGGSITPFFGTRCENACTSDLHCGGALQPLADGTPRNIGVCDKNTLRCVCANGWSGVQCRTEPSTPPGSQCFNDAECSWGGVSRGACDEASKACACLTDQQGRPVYTGPRCSTRMIYEGAACQSDKDCKDASNKCVNGKCRSPDDMGDGKPTPREVAAAIVAGILTPEGLLNMAIDEYVEHMIGKIATSAAAMARTVEARAAQTLSDSAIKSSTSKVGAEMTAKLAAKTVSKAAASSVSSSIITRIGAKLVSAVKSINPLTALILILQIWTMVLDINDRQGLNEMVGQDQLEMLSKQMVEMFNSDPDVIEAGLTLPLPFYPRNTVPYKLEALTPESLVQNINDQADYLSRLTVNSAGQRIVPMFNPPAAIAAQAALAAKQKAGGGVNWALSGGDERVYANLAQYGWALWTLGGLIITSVVLICVFTSESVLAKLHKKN